MAFNSSSVIGMVDSFYIMQDLTDIRGIRNFLIIGIAHVIYSLEMHREGASSKSSEINCNDGRILIV